MYLIKTNFHDLIFYICISISESICNSVYSCTDTARSDNPNATQQTEYLMKFLFE